MTEADIAKGEALLKAHHHALYGGNPFRAVNTGPQLDEWLKHNAAALLQSAREVQRLREALEAILDEGAMGCPTYGDAERIATAALTPDGGRNETTI